MWEEVRYVDNDVSSTFAADDSISCKFKEITASGRTNLAFCVRITVTQ
jgi:hypothetical protein